MSRCFQAIYSVTMCFPRVSGDEPERAVALAATLGFSPRERG